jgi:hypothetical protein
MPGPPEFWNDTESSFDDISAKTPITVGAGESATGIDIILNNTPPRFDEFEDSGGLFWHMAPLAGAEVVEVRA